MGASARPSLSSTSITSPKASSNIFAAPAANALDQLLSNASPAIADGSLLIHTATRLYRIVGEMVPAG